MKYTLILVFNLIVGSCFGQIHKNDFNGGWTMCNEDKKYDIADSIILYQDINHDFQRGKKDCCHLLTWQIQDGKIVIEKINACSEPGLVTRDYVDRRINISQVKGYQLFSIYAQGKLLDKFKIIKYETSKINRYPYEIKLLVLKRERI